MPYPNSHSARLRSPSGYLRVRRENDKFAPGIDAVWGVQMKGGKETSVLQAIRFDRTKYSESQAKAWLKEKGFSAAGFEPASGKTALAAKIVAGVTLSGRALGVEVLRPGTFTDASGKKVTITTQDLKDIVRNFRASSDVPMVLGHPKDGKASVTVATDTPAAGWASRFYIRGAMLLADVGDIPDTVTKWIRDKVYRKISLKLQRGYNGAEGYVARHIGLLGATPPAVKGLADFPKITLSGNVAGGVTLEFTEEGGQVVTREQAVKKLKKFGAPASSYADKIADADVVKLAEKMDGLDTSKLAAETSLAEAEQGKAEAEKTAEEEKAAKEEAEKKLKEAGASGEGGGSGGGDGEGDKSESEKKGEAALAEARKVSEDFLGQIKERDRLERIERVKELTEHLVKDGKMSPAEVGGFTTIALSLVDDREKVVEFGEGKEKTKVSRFDAYCKAAEARIPSGAFSELSQEEAEVEVNSKKEKVVAEAKTFYRENVELADAYLTEKDFVEGRLIEAGFEVEKKE